MPNRNLHEVMGHLGKDPELKITPTGKSVCRLSVATSNRIFCRNSPMKIYRMPKYRSRRWSGWQKLN